MKLKLGLLIVATFAMITADCASAQIGALLSGDVRVTGDLDELPGGGNPGDENGGFTGLIVGINTGNVQNWALMGFDTAPAAGAAVTGATLSIAVVTDFTNGNHGSSTDTLSIHELFAPNTTAGWDPGTGTITNTAGNVSQDGVVTFQQRGFNTDDWLDASGNSVDNIIGAYDGNSALQTFQGWDEGSAPDFVTYEFDQATAERWAAAGVADLILQVNDLDGTNTSRYNLFNGSPTLTFNVVPEPSSALLVIGSVLGLALRRRK